MAFYQYARKVRNPLLPLGQRRSALGSCLLRFAWLTNQKYSTIGETFAPRLGQDPGNPLTEQEMQDALTALERERNRLLERLRCYQIHRVRTKARGRRTTRQSQAEFLSASWVTLRHERQ